MEIIYLKSIDSTHTYLQNYIKKNGYKNPLAIITQDQTAGKGSRENSWLGLKGDLFFSFVLDKSLLPNDLPIQSFSLYFSYILKEILKDKGSEVWLKWPNDFYIKENKIGGTITNIKSNLVFCGIGLNLVKKNRVYSSLDIDIDIDSLLKEFFLDLNRKNSWKQIFSKFSLEFEKSKEFKTTVDNEKISLDTAVLNSDGSINIDKKKVFNLR